MGKKMTRAGAELRRAIRADIDANPEIDHKLLRSKYTVGEQLVESALTKTLAEWDAVVAATPEDVPRPARQAPSPVPATATNGGSELPGTAAMPGIEQGVIKFARKPAKMGEDYIFWIPRVYIKNGLVDPHAEYEVYLKKKT
ncbi:MAG: hypothetical protein GYA24_15490 [Candidatus Lokiarchaeota archaeon]|nr:hypothetical protein [Candidatus Lokiarchaeota archaeon]